MSGCFFLNTVYYQWSNYEGARGGLAPLKDQMAPSKHVVREGGTRGPLKGPPEITCQIQYLIMQHINFILSTDGAAPSPAT